MVSPWEGNMDHLYKLLTKSISNSLNLGTGRGLWLHVNGIVN